MLWILENRTVYMQPCCCFFFLSNKHMGRSFYAAWKIACLSLSISISLSLSRFLWSWSCTKFRAAWSVLKFCILGVRGGKSKREGGGSCVSHASPKCTHCNPRPFDSAWFRSFYLVVVTESRMHTTPTWHALNPADYFEAICAMEQARWKTFLFSLKNRFPLHWPRCNGAESV